MNLSIELSFFFLTANLSALVYQHTLTPLALPTKLVLPSVDIVQDYRPTTSQQQTQTQQQQQQETKKMSIKELLDKGAGKNRSIK